MGVAVHAEYHWVGCDGCRSSAGWGIAIVGEGGGGEREKKLEMWRSGRGGWWRCEDREMQVQLRRVEDELQILAISIMMLGDSAEVCLLR